MGYFENVKACTFMTKFVMLMEFDKSSRITKKYKGDVAVELCCHVLFQAPVSFEISKFFIFWTDLA